jgi:SAM-dependent methyltransferase
VSLRDAWDAQAENWIAWTRSEIDRAFLRFNAAAALAIMPPPRGLTLDLGAGEGRLGRVLRAAGYHVVECEQSPRLARASAELTPGAGVLGDVTHLPLRAAVADLAIAFMSFQDVDDMPGAVAEVARVLRPGGAFVVAIVHPINSGGEFDASGTRFTLYPSSYFDDRHYADDVDKNGVQMRFESRHRSIEAYSRAFEAAGFVIEVLREVGDPDPSDKWHRVPLFLHCRCRLVA